MGKVLEKSAKGGGEKEKKGDKEMNNYFINFYKEFVAKIYDIQQHPKQQPDKL